MKRSHSILFREAIAKLNKKEFYEFVDKHHSDDIALRNDSRGILSFPDSSWAEWTEYTSGSIDVWAYKKRDGHPFKSNPQRVDP